jgi:putative protein-disulfide isomerase
MVLTVKSDLKANMKTLKLFVAACAIWLLFTGATLHKKSTTMKNKLMYVYDPMCGWCFGFGKVMNEFVAQQKDSFQIEIVSGGMVVGDREGEVGDFADYILGAYKRVEEMSGVKFGEAYLSQLKTKKLWSSSVKPSIALETFKTFNQKDAVAFGHKIQEAYFVQGKDLRDDKVYAELIKPYGINEQEFLTKLNSEEMRKAATDWFQTTANWGVKGYPMVILIHNGSYYAVAQGYTSLQNLNATIQKVISEPAR